MKKAVFLFPGQGSQSVGMGEALVQEFPVAARLFAEADQALGFSISKCCFQGPDEALTATENAQPAVTLLNLAVMAVLAEKGVEPLATAGHSLGEYAANVAAGTMDAIQAITLTRVRGRLMQSCADRRPGAMVAVIGLDTDVVDRICREVAVSSGGVVGVANFNSPQQVVITGESEPVALASSRLTEAGAKRTVPLTVSGPWHSPLMQDAQNQFGSHLSTLPFRAPSIPLYANIDASRKATPAAVVEALTLQITGSVRWVETVMAIRRDFPDAAFLECGPGKVLKGLLRQIDREAVCLGVECPKSLAAALEALGA